MTEPSLKKAESLVSDEMRLGSHHAPNRDDSHRVCRMLASGWTFELRQRPARVAPGRRPSSDGARTGSRPDTSNIPNISSKVGLGANGRGMVILGGGIMGILGTSIHRRSGREPKNSATMKSRPTLLSTLALILCAGALGAACSRGEGAGIEPNTEPKFSPRRFGNPAAGRNRWLPLKPGLQTIRKGLVNVGDRRVEHLRVYTVTDVSKTINGVRTVIVLDQDFNGEQLAEQALDYLAEDKKGNVWYLGSYTETYEGGQFVNATDGWLAGVNGSEGGILMLAQPKVGLSYVDSNALGEGPEVSEVIKTNESECVPFDCYKDVVVIREGGEHKYYAPGVGGIRTAPRYSGGEQETEILINVRRLSPTGLAEFSNEVLRVDRHAEEVVPDVFADAAAAKRSL
jgi:hypothetical protein